MDLPTRCDDGSASKRLFMKLYRVRAPRSLTMSKAEIELYGQRITGIKDLDKYLANEMVNGRVNTIRMANIVYEGGSIQFCNKFDALDCYRDLCQHFLNWEVILTTNYNIVAPPEEDIIILREFQEALEAYRGVLDRKDTTTTPIGKFTVLNNKNFNRKGFADRVRIDPNFGKQIPVITDINNWEDLQDLRGER